jgi:hypothetical protein
VDPLDRLGQQLGDRKRVQLRALLLLIGHGHAVRGDHLLDPRLVDAIDRGPRRRRCTRLPGPVWWSWHGAPLLIIGEYDKYLAAWMRPALNAVYPPPPGSGSGIPTIETGSMAQSGPR